MPLQSFLEPEWLDSVDSTNKTLRRRIEAGEALPSGYVLAAREQTAGKGRLDHGWVSRAGDLFFSFVLHVDKTDLQTLSLPMAVAIGIAKKLAPLGLAAATSWPNDVLVGGKKIGGVLAERASLPGGAGKPCIVGVGLNVNMPQGQADAIEQPATSLLIETGASRTPGAVLDELLPELAEWIRLWELGGFACIAASYAGLCGDLGRELTIQDLNARFSGKVVGFGEHGELLLLTSRGEVVPVWTGNTVRK